MLLALLACAPAPSPGPGEVWQDLDAVAAGDFYAAPWPHLDRVLGDGTADLSGFPNPGAVDLVAQLVALGHGQLDGAGTTSGIWFRSAVPIDADSLPGPVQSTTAGGGAMLVDVDPSSPERGRRIPLTVAYEADAGPFGDAHLLSLLPVQGIPLRPGTLYAAALTTSLRTEGRPLAAWPGYAALLEAEGELGTAARGLLLPAGVVAGFTAFRTQDPREALRRWVAHARAATPAAAPADLSLVEVFDDYCVYEGTTAMPVFQVGEPPYLAEGGAILEDAAGLPVLDHWETARAVVTVARAGGPVQPVVVFVRTGGGGDRPLVDRGARDASGAVLEEGSGLARDFARAGWAAISVDGPHGGLRNVTGGDEQFLLFNIGNPAAMRDNLRQSALELALLPDLLAALAVPAGDCPDLAQPVQLDPDRLALFGHSMGATIGPLAVGAAPEYRALLLSGAGGSWVENVVHKELPLHVAPIAEAMLGYAPGQLDAHDPALHLLQWVGESADPPVWGRDLQAEGVEVLMLQGIVDHYILPPIANAASLALGLDLAGVPLDAEEPALADYTPLSVLLPLVGGAVLPLPAGDNQGGVTRLVVQHAEDGIEDGHEVVFQREGPREQVRAFLEGLAMGGPVVPAVEQR